MKLLAIDTATLVASVAVVDDGRVLAACERAVSTHSDVLLELIDAALGEAGLRVRDVDGVAVGAGPGSFTGLRIGLATAKGLCFAEDKPLYVASSLAALALDAGPTDGVVGAVIDAKKDEVFVACFDREGETLRAVSDERVMRPAQLAAFVHEVASGRAVSLLGTGAQAYPDACAAAGTVLAGARATPSAASIARLAQAGGKPADIASAAPTYIRLSEAELKWRKHIP